MIMEGDPFALIEGMAIAGFAVGATKGYVYSRSEYPHANATFAKALDVARAANLIGKDFDIELRIGAGAYVCGEETALLESLEGKRGQVRAKPPLPAHEGLFGKPTIINNVLSLATAPWILAQRRRRLRRHRLRQVARHHADPTRRQREACGPVRGAVRHDAWANSSTTSAAARPRAARCARCSAAARWAPISRARSSTRPTTTKPSPPRDGLIGHGGIVVFDDTVDMAAQARFAMEFCAIESCGKCTPCRIGSTRGVEVIDRILAGEQRDMNLALIEDLCRTLKLGSLCALGGFTPYPVLSALRHFPGGFRHTRKTFRRGVRWRHDTGRRT